MNRLQKNYIDNIRPQLQKELELKNIQEVPNIDKIVVNSGVGKAVADKKYLEEAVETLTKITAQKPVVTRAKHSIASYKLRENMPIGVKVTLRGERMWYFLDRLISVVIPRMRDFRGLPLSSFDPQGNYSIGINDQTVFSEISINDASATHGLQVNIVTSKNSRQNSIELLKKLGLPLQKGDNNG